MWGPLGARMSSSSPVMSLKGGPGQPDGDLPVAKTSLLAALGLKRSPRAKLGVVPGRERWGFGNGPSRGGVWNRGAFVLI